RPAARKGSCGATTRAGAACPANAMSGSLPTRCFHHSSNAEVAERRTLARQMGGLRATQRKLGADLPVDLASRDGVRLLLESAITAVSKGQLTPTQGTAINQLALTALRMRELESEVALIDAQKLA